MHAVHWFLMIIPAIMLVGLIRRALKNSRDAPARGSAGYDVATGQGVWFAQVRAPGLHFTTPRNMATDWGQLRVSAGQVSFTPDGAQAPAWTIPANQLAVQRPTGMATAFRARVPQVGEVIIEPSTSKMARWRTPGSWAGSSYRTTQDVVTILQGWGAH